MPYQRDFLIAQLDRPLRVCGVGEKYRRAGGGPLLGQTDRRHDLAPNCRVFPSRYDKREQRARWQAATHFNPVDLVCGVRDYRGRPFPLAHFVDPATGFISEKSKDGRSLRALELPGLWNGAMAHWNTVFVEVPGSTFHPVKTVMDLLRPEHQPTPVPPLTTRLN